MIEYKGKTLEFGDNSIGFFPSDIDYTRITNGDKMIVIHFKAFNYHSNEIEYFLPSDHKKYRLLFEKISDCWNKKNMSYIHEAASGLNLIFAELYKDNKREYANHSKIEMSVRYIGDNYLKKDISLHAAAKNPL